MRVQLINIWSFKTVNSCIRPQDVLCLSQGCSGYGTYPENTQKYTLLDLTPVHCMVPCTHSFIPQAHQSAYQHIFRRWEETNETRGSLHRYGENMKLHADSNLSSCLNQ